MDERRCGTCTFWNITESKYPEKSCRLAENLTKMFPGFIPVSVETVMMREYEGANCPAWQAREAS